MDDIKLEKINLALVGCGGISNAHVEGFKDLFTRGLKVFEIKAVCDVLEENARVKADTISHFQGSKPIFYTNIEKMLKNENLDAVDICLPHYLHHTVTSRCLEADLHVIVEKPLGITMRAAKIIIDKVVKHSKTLAVAENYRRAPNERATWWAIRQGLIGEPRMVLWSDASWGPKPWGWREDKFAAGGSWVFDAGVHWADLDRYQLGREAVEVFSINHNFIPVKEGVKVTVDDITMAIVRYEGEVFSQWFWTSAAPAKRIHMHVLYGSKGAISDDGIHIQKPHDTVEIRSTDVLVNTMKKNLKPEELEKFFPRGANTFATELYDFYDSIINKRNPEIDMWEAYKDMAIPLGFYESAAVGIPVKVKDIEELRVEEYQKEVNEKLGI